MKKGTYKRLAALGLLGQFGLRYPGGEDFLDCRLSIHRTHYHVRVRVCQHQRDGDPYYDCAMNKLLDTPAQRLIWAREKKELTQEALAKLVGVRQSTIGNLETGYRKSAKHIAKIAEVLGVDALWLVEGKGQPTREGRAGAPATEAAPRLQFVTDEEAELLDLFRCTDSDGKGAIIDVARIQPRVVLPTLIRNNS